MDEYLSWADQQRAGELVAELHKHTENGPPVDGEEGRTYWATYRQIATEIEAILPAVTGPLAS